MLPTARRIIAGVFALALVTFVVVRVTDSDPDDGPDLAPPAIAGVTIAAAGDAVCAPGSAKTPTTCRQMAVSDRILADPQVTMYLALGDLQYDNGALASFRTAYDESFGRLKARTKPAPGNHEYETPEAKGYYTYFGSAAGDPTKGYYTFDVGTSRHVVALNSNCTFVACTSRSAQERWLRTDLAASDRPCTLAFWHHPRFSSNEYGDDPTVAAFWDALQAAGAELVLNGHDHGYERFDPQTPSGAADPNGIREFVAGTGGRSLYRFGPPHANSAARIATFGYLRLTLGTDAYAWQFVTENGAVVDSGTGTCH